MQSVFKLIRKKVNLRRLSAVWLVLIVVELFCPTLCDASAFSGEPDSTRTSWNVSKIISQNAPTEDADYVSACDHSNADHGQRIVCHDECLCHATAIPNLGFFNHQDAITKSDPIAFNFSNPLLNFLPPPDNPPKLS